MPATQHGGGFSQPTVAARMGSEKIEMMLAHILRLPEVFAFAVNNLRPELFSEGTEDHYRLLWRTAMDVFRHQPPSFFDNPDFAYAKLELEVVSRARNRIGGLHQSYWDRLFSQNPQHPGLMYWIFRKILRAELTVTWGKEMLRDFRIEREVGDALHQVITHADGKTISNIPELLQSLKDRYVAIRAQQSDRAGSGAPEDWAPRPLIKVSTGLDFLNKFLKGGHAGGECYGVLGAYGSGKTCLACQLLAGGAKVELNRAEHEEGYRPKHWFLFTYEAIYDEIIVRLWSSQCTIHHDNLENFSKDKLTSIANGKQSLHDYELNKFKEEADNNTIKGELERWQEKTSWLNQNLWIQDMTGTMGNPLKGTGYIPEIAELVQSELHALKGELGYEPQVGGIIIDYAGLVASRYLMQSGKDRSEMRHLVGWFGYNAKIQLAVPFDCPVWVFHQLDTKAQGRISASKAHHTESAEAKNFAENLSFALQLGVKDRQHNALFLNCTKARRGALGEAPILRLEGEFYRLVEAPDLTLSHGKICPKAEANFITTEEQEAEEQMGHDNAFS